MVYNKGYQEAENVVSAVTTKVKGVTLTKYTDLELEAVPREWRGLYNRIWDVTDYVVPSQENNALFLMTNAVITPNQTRGECAEKGVWNCRGDKDCPEGGVNHLGDNVTDMRRFRESPTWVSYISPVNGFLLQPMVC